MLVHNAGSELYEGCGRFLQEDVLPINYYYHSIKVGAVKNFRANCPACY